MRASNIIIALGICLTNLSAAQSNAYRKVLATPPGEDIAFAEFCAACITPMHLNIRSEQLLSGNPEAVEAMLNTGMVPTHSEVVAFYKKFGNNGSYKLVKQAYLKRSPDFLRGCGRAFRNMYLTGKESLVDAFAW